MEQQERFMISGMEDGVRIESRVLEERVQEAVARGRRNIRIEAFGQHGLGGRLWGSGSEPVKVGIIGYPGQRVGSMGSPLTTIDVYGPASDDVGWLNAGATIVVHGDATNGVGNAMAQGTIYVAGDIGARGMTMTKSNPRYTPPQLWVLGGVGDSFAEFMAGGVAVVCGHNSHYRDNILGHRPCVGMVGGKIFFRGPHRGYSQSDARLTNLSDGEWTWLQDGAREFLKAVGREELFHAVCGDRSEWGLLVALLPHERSAKKPTTMEAFRAEVWDRELGEGGLIGDLTSMDLSPVPVIATGDLRRFVPRWENHKYQPPCQAGCPTGIPVQKRWELIRQGRINEAVDLALEYTPFPATVCGYLCPNLCMEGCTRTMHSLLAVDVTVLGRASENARDLGRAKATGRKVAVIGGGPAGLSVAWRLWLDGHDPVVFDRAKALGGKVSSVIPTSRFPREVFAREVERVAGKVAYKRIERKLTPKKFEAIRDSHDAVVVATGAQVPRVLKIRGSEKAVPALAFLELARHGKPEVGERLVVIGAGNVGCDVAAEGHRHGARDITLIDIRRPASFGKEREGAEKIGAKFLWPVSASAITAEGVELSDGRVLPADTVVFSMGDQPDTSFLPENIERKNGYVVVDGKFSTSDPKVYAIGDTVKPGLLTDAIGAGRQAARALDAALRGAEESFDSLPLIDTRTVKLEYYDPRAGRGSDLGHCSTECASCGGCRDCGVCEAICPRQAIARRDLQGGGYEYAVDGALCIGCGFCAGTCPCGVWELRENEPLE